MAHDNYQMMISLALDNELDEAESKILAQHLQTCTFCATMHDQMQIFNTMFENPPAIAPPVNLVNAVMGRVQRYENNRRWYPLVIGILVVSSLLAALTLAMPIILVTLGLDGIADQWPQMAVVLSSVVQGMSFVGQGSVLLFEMLIGWLTFLISDPIALSVVIGALTLASTWIGVLESMKFSRLAHQRQTS